MLFLSGGLSTTAMVKVQVIDVNDNRPIFYPSEYNVSLRESRGSPSSNAPVVVVAATDLDSGRYGTLSYKIVSGNEAGMFRIDHNSGEISLSKPNVSLRRQPYYRLNISATDADGLKSLKEAVVFISVIDVAQRPPIFEHSQYAYYVLENEKNNTIVGSVKATVADNGKLLQNLFMYVYTGFYSLFLILHSNIFYYTLYVVLNVCNVNIMIRTVVNLKAHNVPSTSSSNKSTAGYSHRPSLCFRSGPPKILFVTSVVF